jgi:FHS family L-fucose permease-like MFS transporter
MGTCGFHRVTFLQRTLGTNTHKPEFKEKRMSIRPNTTGSDSVQSTLATSATPNYSRPLAIVTTLFFMWGFLTCLNDILIPHLKSVFDLSYARAMLIQFAFFSAYFLFSVPWSRVVNAIGYKTTMLVGLLTMALGAFLFVLAASALSYPLFLSALLVLAAGITGLQVSANPYVDLLGKPETASSRLDLTQAFNSLGTTIAPKIGGLLILSAAPMTIAQLQLLNPEALRLYHAQQASSVKLPYAMIGVSLLLLTGLIALSKLPKIEAAPRLPGEQKKDSIWKHRSLLLGAVGIFAYVGAEVSIGSFLVNYFGLPEIAAFSAKTASGYVSFYWGGAMIGRFIGAPLLQRFKPRYLLALCAVPAAALVVTSMLTHGHTAMWTILAVGFFNAIMFPTIFSLGEAGLGTLSGSGSGLLNMAIVGGAILPVIQGVIADRVGIHHAFVLPVICYIYILFYALRGSEQDGLRLSNN